VQSWALSSSHGKEYKLQHQPRLLCSDYTVQYEAAVGGVGIALLPLRVAWRGLQAGSLVHVAKDWSSAEQDIHLVFVSRRGMLPAVRALIDNLVQQIPKALAS
jgi:DNA-binding transcriptional LysR family regulator